jgi:hypoxanthine phosphoribosyltransferase
LNDKSLLLRFILACIAAFTVIACFLIFFKVGGSAQFDLLGQSFSSSNIGLAVLFIAAALLAYVIRELRPAGGASAGTPESTSPSEETISWQETIAGIDELVLQLTAADGFRPDIVIGICGGGLMVADVIAKRLGHVPCLSIWAARHSHTGTSPFGGSALVVNALNLDELFVARATERILLVDDVAYSGGTLAKAVDFLKDRSPMLTGGAVEMKTAVLFALTSASFKADFTVYTHSRSRRMMPSSDRLRRLLG